MPEIESIDQEVRPIIVQFQNSKLQVGQEKKLKTGVYKNTKNRENVVAVATKDILYTGNVNSDDDLYNTFIIISNKETGKVRLVSADMTVLAPQLKQEDRNLDLMDNSSSNLNSTMNELNKKFGSKKTKRMTEQKERLQMDIEDVKEQLEETVAAVEISQSDVFNSTFAEPDSTYRPRINRDASSKEQVYNLDDLVPDFVLDSLENQAHEVLSSELDAMDLSPFIRQHIESLQDSSSSRRLEKCKLMLFIDYLIKYISKPARVITKNFIACQVSQEANKYILENFSVFSGHHRTRPVSIRDKAICHILVLSMLALDYEVNIEALSKDVKLGLKKLYEMGRILAFSFHSKNKTMMVLKMPLPPAVSFSPKKRKR